MVEPMLEQVYTEWANLVSKAYHTLTSEAFSAWKFAIAESGFSLGGKIALGKKALEVWENSRLDREFDA